MLYSDYFHEHFHCPMLIFPISKLIIEVPHYLESVQSEFILIINYEINRVVGTVPANGLASLGAGPFACTVKHKFVDSICTILVKKVKRYIYIILRLEGISKQCPYLRFKCS